MGLCLPPSPHVSWIYCSSLFNHLCSCVKQTHLLLLARTNPTALKIVVIHIYIYKYINMASFQFSEGQDAWHVLIPSYSKEKGSSRSSRMISASTESWGTGETNSALKKHGQHLKKLHPSCQAQASKAFPKGSGKDSARIFFSMSEVFHSCRPDKLQRVPVRKYVS